MLRFIVLLAAVSAAAFDGGVPKAPPKGLTVASWASIRAEHLRHLQAAFPEDGGHRARNYSQQFVTRFDGRGFEVTPNSGDWRWGLQLRSYGFTGQERTVQNARVTANVEKLSYRWDPLITEWFINEARGLEHGFTLTGRPGRSDSPLLLHLTVHGKLSPRISQDRRQVSFLDPQGSTAINYSGLRVVDAKGVDLKTHFIAEAAGLRLEIEERDASYPITMDPVVQQAYLKPGAVGHDQIGDLFGYSVSVSGLTVVVGAPYENSSTLLGNNVPDETAVKAGAAYVFVLTSQVWVQQAYLKPRAVGTKQDGDQFGTSVSISGDTIVVGAPREDSASFGVGSTPIEGATDSGAAYVFVRQGQIWNQQVYLKMPVAGLLAETAMFGWSVAVSGDLVVVGAYDETNSASGVDKPVDHLASGAGAAFIFGRDRSGVWTQRAYLKASNTQANDHFGASVAISGDTVVIGAPNEDSASTGVNSVPDNLGSDSGAAYIFTLDPANLNKWIQVAYLKPGPAGPPSTHPQIGDNFGASVAVSGDTVVVGAPGDDSSTKGVNSIPDELSANSGAAYVFVQAASGWSQQAYLKSGLVAGVVQVTLGDNFGCSVAISGDTIVVGARGEDSDTTGVNSLPNEGALDSGAAFVFVRSGTAWSQDAYLKSDALGTTKKGDSFGFSVSVSADLIVVGAQLEDGSSTGINQPHNAAAIDAGAAYVFTAPVPSSITVTTVPTGLVFSVAGGGCAPGTYTAPQSLTWTSGSSCTLSLATPQSAYAFRHWEDNSASTVRTVIAPSPGSLLVHYEATFVPQPFGLQLDSVMNIATLIPGQPVAPGSAVGIFGGGFLPGGTGGANLSLPIFPDTIEGVTVTFNGVTAPLDGVGPTEIIAQVPWGTTNPASVIVTVNTFPTAPLSVQIAPVAPGVLNFSGLAMAFNDDGTLVAKPRAIPGFNSHGAAVGDRIQVLVTGLGAVSPPIKDGRPSSDATRTAETPVVRIGGVPAQVKSVTLTPWYTAVYLLVVAIPEGTRGVQPIQVGSGSVMSPASTTIFVQ